MKKPIRIMILALALAGLAGPAGAAEPRLLSQNGKWNAYMFRESSGPVCYMSAKPDKTRGAEGKKRGDVYALVTHRPGESSEDVITIIAGYSYKPQSEALLEIGGRKYKLFTKDDAAWAMTREADQEIARAIASGSDMKVTGTSSRGTTTTDSFSLSGSGAALKAIDEACGIRR